MRRAVVVGGGIMGLAAGAAMAKRGARVTLVDPRPLVNEHNASNDVSKVFRFAYRDEREHVALAQRALVGWRALEKATGESILHATGLLMLPGAFRDESAPTLRAVGLPCDEVDPEARWPVFRGTREGSVDPNGGWLDPRAALRAFERVFVSAGGVVRCGARVAEIRGGDVVVASLEDGAPVEADVAVVAAGFEAPALLPELRGRIVVTRQPELFFGVGTVYRPGWPVFAALEEGFYGFPPAAGAFKIADHRKGHVVTDFERRAPVADEEVETARAWLRRRMPDLAEAPLVGSRICLYDNTADDRLILGPSRELRNVVVAAGFSGHGFKFAPAIGDDLAAMALR